jgi:hypothetical protein
METNHQDDLSLLAGRWTSPAIYAVLHVPTGKQLICAAKSLAKRISDHRRLLRERRHWNKGVQQDLANGGPDDFEFVVLELPRDARELPRLRQQHLEQALAKGSCYNAAVPVTRTTIQMDPALLGRLRR